MWKMKNKWYPDLTKITLKIYKLISKERKEKALLIDTNYFIARNPMFYYFFKARKSAFKGPF